MQKTILGVLAAGLLLITSCSKNNSSPGNSWTFRTVTYNATTCQGVASTLTASNLSGSNTATYGTLECTFNGTTLPASGSIDTVVSGVPTNNKQIGISATINGASTSYRATGGNGIQLVTVSVSNGKVAVSGSGIELVNTGTASDSSSLTLNITQLQ